MISLLLFCNDRMCAFESRRSFAELAGEEAAGLYDQLLDSSYSLLGAPLCRSPSRPVLFCLALLFPVYSGSSVGGLPRPLSMILS